MNAKEAREKSLSISSDKERKNYESLMIAINLAVSRGVLYANYYKEILPAVKSKLESEGYEISVFSDQKDGNTITIKW